MISAMASASPVDPPISAAQITPATTTAAADPKLRTRARDATLQSIAAALPNGEGNRTSFGALGRARSSTRFGEERSASAALAPALGTMASGGAVAASPAPPRSHHAPGGASGPVGTSQVEILIDVRGLVCESPDNGHEPASVR